MKGLLSVGLERPVLAPFTLDPSIGQNNVEAGELGGRPVVSFGTGIETGDVRIASNFGWQSLKFYTRGTWGEFKDRFSIAGCPSGAEGFPGTDGKTPGDTGAVTLSAAVAAANGLTCNDPNEAFTNWTSVGTFDIVGIGTAKKGRAGTLRLRSNGVYTQGDGTILNSSFGTRVFLKGTALDETRAVGGFINPMFFITDDLSRRLPQKGELPIRGEPLVDAGALDLRHRLQLHQHPFREV